MSLSFSLLVIYGKDYPENTRSSCGSHPVYKKIKRLYLLNCIIGNNWDNHDYIFVIFLAVIKLKLIIPLIFANSCSVLIQSWCRNEVGNNFAVFRDGIIVSDRSHAIKSMLLFSGLSDDTLTRTAMLNYVMMSIT